ncbi:sensor histidine kinase [Paenibacillus psychroresistens]|uniref:sensor histidine kinase n=1 Tax=Paenibacillus psychroresistens TaxID=1778678 RepID=UPI001390869C|nr:histidine kinase [Paenibacillus psychroresistens]
MRFINNLNIFPKLVLTFLVIIIPLIIISLATNIRSERLVRNEITSSMQAKVNYYLTALEYSFAPLISIQQQYLIDEDINNLAYTSSFMSDQLYTETFKSVQNKLTILKYMSSYVEDAFVYIPAFNRKVSAASFDPIHPDEAAAMNQLTDTYSSPFILFNNSLWMSRPYPSFTSIGKGFTLGLQISSSALQKSLSSFSINGNGGAMLMNEDLSWNEIGGNIPANIEKTKQTIKQNLLANQISGYESFQSNKTKYYAFYEKSPKLGLTLAIFVDENSFIGPIKQFATWLWWISIASILVILLFSYQIYQVIHTPLKQLTGAFRNVEKGNLSTQLSYRSKDEFNYLYLQFNRMVFRLDELINEVYVQKYQVKVAELKQLQSQINPHFLYNCFFNLYRLAKMHELDKVIPFTKNLGDYFKYVTKTADFVPLEQEINFCLSYVAIQNIRFEDHIQVEFGMIPEKFTALNVPKLFLQPLIENCYKHGLEDNSTGGLIQISFAENANYFEISVEDNGTILSDTMLEMIRAQLEQSDKMTDSEGLLNVKQRLMLHFGNAANLEVNRGKLGGLIVVVMIPIEEEINDVPSDDRR